MLICYFWLIISFVTETVLANGISLHHDEKTETDKLREYVKIDLNNSLNDVSCEWSNISASNSNYYRKITSCMIATDHHFIYSTENGGYGQWSCKNTLQEVELNDGIGEKLSFGVAHAIVFLGDSIMRQQYFSFLCVLGIQRNVTNESTSGAAELAVVWRNLTIRFVPSGLGNVWGRAISFSEAVEKELKSLGPSDIVIANLGIHINDLYSPAAKETYNQLIENVVGVIRRLRETLGNDMPKFYWRESTPQNHPTTNGLWSSECHMRCKCVPLTNNMLLGIDDMSSGKNHTACVPNCLPNNFRNIIANKKMLLNDIAIIKVYDVLASTKGNVHVSLVDCTHMRLSTLAFMNQRLIQALFANKG